MIMADWMSPDMMPVWRATEDDLDMDKVEAFFKRRKRIEGIDSATTAELLESYCLTIADGGIQVPTIAGMLLFGKDPERRLSECVIYATRFSGIDGWSVISRSDITGTLDEQYRGALEFVLNQQLEIPEIALREAIMNAIVHRDYRLPAALRISIYDDRVEIFSPGGFIKPIPDLIAGASHMRNLVISTVMNESGYCQKTGSGFGNIFKSYAERGLPKPEIIADLWVKVILPRPCSD